jgi:hypothetical protein
MRIRHYVLGVVAAAAALPALAADIDGRWNATVESPMGPVNLVFEFKAEGEKLTGLLATEMGGQAMPGAPISEGTVKGEDVAFKWSMQFMPDAPPMVIDYKGKLKGDELDLTSVVPDMGMGQGAQETKLVAKRAK